MGIVWQHTRLPLGPPPAPAGFASVNEGSDVSAAIGAQGSSGAAAIAEGGDTAAGSGSPGGVTFNFFIAPNGDDSNNGLTPATAWSLSALNSKQSTYTGQNIGIVGDIAGVQTPITQTSIAGTVTTLYAAYQAQPGNGSGCIFNINGGTAVKSTYIASCNSSGVYTPRWAVIDCSLPGSGGATVPTVAAYLMGQNFNLGSVPKMGFTTVDGLVIKYFTMCAVAFSHTGIQGPVSGMLNVVVQNCEISNGGNIIPDNNPGAISLAGCYAPVITNNKVHDLQTVTGGGGSSVPWGHHALMTYMSNAMVVTNNTFYNCNAIMTKDTFQDFANCSYNYLDHGVFGSANGGQNISQAPIQSNCPGAGVISNVHHNIILGAANFSAQSGTNQIAGTANLYNNTFYGSAAYTFPFSAVECNAATSGSAIQFQNNIVWAASNSYDNGNGYGNCIWILTMTVSNSTFNNNVYGANGNGVRFGRTAGQNLALAAAQSTLSIDSTSVSIATTPFSGTPTAQVPSSFATNSLAIIGGVTCGALDGSGAIGCNF